MAEVVRINYGAEAKELCMLLSVWQEDTPLTGYYVSEKMDGIRSIWTGEKFITREGKKIQAPHWFTSGLPHYPLDGELWMGRGIAMFDKINGLIKGNHWSQPKLDSTWLQVKYMIFDVPVVNETFERRCYKYLRQRRAHFGEHAFLVRSTIITSKAHFNAICKKVREEGGEGLVARKPNSFYVFKRSPDVLKIKFWSKGVAQIQAVGRTTCRCYTDEGIEIYVPYIREAAIDKVFVFKCLGRTSDELPRFPTFVSWDVPDSLPPIPPVFKGEFTTRVPKMLGWESGKLDKEEPTVELYNNTLTPPEEEMKSDDEEEMKLYLTPPEEEMKVDDEEEIKADDEEEMQLYLELTPPPEEETSEDEDEFEETANGFFDRIGI
jgi:hypothetical protein